MKKTLLAVMFCAFSISSYANSVVPGTEKKVTEELTINAISEIDASISLDSKLTAGKYIRDTSIGSFTANVSGGMYAVRGDISAGDYDQGAFAWTINGLNDPKNKIKVRLLNDGEKTYGDFSGDGGIWRAFDSGQKVGIVFDTDQTVAADKYPITLNFAKFER